MNVAVIGGHKCSRKHYRTAQKLGELIAGQGWILICGGREGVMEAVCRGAKKAGGLTVGILPSSDGKDANPFVDVKIPTGLGYARNVLVVRAADAVVAISGKEGTLSEIAFALSEGKRVFGLDTWNIPGVVKVKSAQAAVKSIKKKQMISSKNSRHMHALKEEI